VVIIVSWLVFLFYGYEPLDALFEVVSATATTGLSTGVTHQQLPAVLKMILCVDMLFGRLEIIAFLVLLYPRNWFGQRS
jgi:trk system potassium uptake protein TrkH